MDALNFFRPPADAQVRFLVGEYGIPVEPVLMLLKARPDNKPPQFHWDPDGLNFLHAALRDYTAEPQHTAKEK